MMQNNDAYQWKVNDVSYFIPSQYGAHTSNSLYVECDPVIQLYVEVQQCFYVHTHFHSLLGALGTVPES